MPVLALALPLAAAAGCGNGGVDSFLDAGVRKLFTPKRTPQQYMLLAVSSEDPDVRRDAVTKIADSKKHNEEWAIKGYVAIATLESNAQTRCVAVRALARVDDPRAAETMLKILNYDQYPPEEVWPPQPLVRWDATEALAELSARGAVPEALRADALATLVERLKLDNQRHARIAAARGLGSYPDEAALEALIRGLRDEDFAVVHQCEDALVRLTGCTHECSAAAWEAWLEEHRDAPFARAGFIPESRRPPYDNQWEKAVYETREFMTWLWPGSKE